MDLDAIAYGARARIGMLLPSGNLAAEAELAAMLPHDVALHTTRLALTGSSREQLLGMIERLDDAAVLLGHTMPSLIVFHCTAVSTWDAAMDATLSGRIRAAAGVRATTTAQGIEAALRALEARKIVLISPYIDEINDREVRFLSGLGVEVLAVHGLGLSTPREMYDVRPGQWRDLALAARHDDADAYFISCTAIRTLGVLAEIERSLGRPVVTSNQIMGWHAMRSCGLPDPLSGLGTLFCL